MVYQLGDVKPWVRDAADHFGHAHGITTIGGYRKNGSVPNSDHPKGLALDYMTRSKATGDALAADLIRNASAWSVKYVIWYRQIWSPGKGWHPYSGPSPHTDHVHASFNDTPGKGGKGVPDTGTRPPGSTLGASVLDPLGVAGAIKGISDQLGEMTRQVASVGKVADLTARLFLPTSIVRGTAFMAGLFFVVVGIWFLSKEIRES